MSGARTPEADFTPHDVNLRLKQNNHTPVTFTFSDTDFTGYTDPKLLFAKAKGDTNTVFAMVITNPTGGVMEVTFDSAAWSSIGPITGGIFQIEALDASLNRAILVNGAISFEWSQ